MCDYVLDEAIEIILSNTYTLSGNMLQDYLIKRYMLLNKIKLVKNINIEKFCYFICDELYLDVSGNHFYFSDNPIAVVSYVEESIHDIVSNWKIFSHLCGFFAMDKNDKGRVAQIESFVTKNIENANRRASKINGIYKKYYYDQYVLKQLNDFYNISPKFPDLMGLFSPTKDSYFSQRNYESVCDAYLHAMLFDTNNHELVLEKDIEEYLYRHPDLLVPNSISVGRQQNIAAGYIADIILRDENYDYIVEVKNKKDDRLYWQAVNYFNVYPLKDNRLVKVITVAPEYSSEMLSSLKELNFVDVKKFRLAINNGKISEMILENL